MICSPLATDIQAEAHPWLGLNANASRQQMTEQKAYRRHGNVVIDVAESEAERFEGQDHALINQATAKATALQRGPLANNGGQVIAATSVSLKRQP